MALNFPANPDTGDTYVVGNATWRFNGLAWDQLAAVPQKTAQTYEAGENLSANRVVRVSNTLAYLCDAATSAHAGTVIGLTTGAALTGATATVQTAGLVQELTWTLTEGPVYVGADGQLTQTVTGLAFVQQIGVAISATQINIHPQLAILH